MTFGALFMLCVVGCYAQTYTFTYTFYPNPSNPGTCSSAGTTFQTNAQSMAFHLLSFICLTHLFSQAGSALLQVLFLAQARLEELLSLLAEALQ